MKKNGDHSGTYADHNDSAIGMTDFDDETMHFRPGTPVESHFQNTQLQYSYCGSDPSQQQRVPSIQSVLHQHPMQSAPQPLIHPHPLEEHVSPPSLRLHIKRSSSLLSSISPEDDLALPMVKQAFEPGDTLGCDSAKVRTSHVGKSKSLSQPSATTTPKSSEDHATQLIEKNTDLTGCSSPRGKQHRSPASASSDSGTENTDSSEISLEISDVDRMQDVDLGKAEIIDRLMICFYDLFADPDFHTHQCSGSSPSSSFGTSRHTPSDGLKQTTGQKRKADNSNGSDGPEDDQSDRKRRKGIDGLRQQAKTEKRFACPYFKNNPQRARTSRACRGPGWTSVHWIK
jgi:hypothetical protein